MASGTQGYSNTSTDKSLSDTLISEYKKLRKRSKSGGSDNPIDPANLKFVQDSVQAVDDFIVSGSLTTPNLIFNGSVTADKIEASLTGSNTIFSSGSTEFGNSMSSSGFNDRHDVTGSISISGSYTLNNSNTIVEISNDTADDGGSQTALATEKVAYNSFGDQQPGFEFVRRKFAHTGSFVSSTTASFTAVTASTVTGLDAVTKHDFMFFNKGMIIEYDALDVQQSGSTFLMKVNPSSLGYGLDSNDEIVAWGKWND